ncbi:hypothetical protein [Leptospirillum ferriphilum]|uniref:Uncharacterized protein n=1 Tax=Leptospirillum ferriphilum YSK TaxID=1441628 RepID=A0A059XWQ8_9BACT|nr:hypothetical protein [Leptospirillum ferriphilum]AIA31560.1 hypothetical protein Y981_03525 [Leptospirillum ferriphilum YSK]
MNAKKETDEIWNLNFPKETALPEKPFALDEEGGGLSVQDLLDPSYPDPIRQAIDRLEKLGYDVGGLWIQYFAMKGSLKTNAAIFREILDLAQRPSSIRR